MGATISTPAELATSDMSRVSAGRSTWNARCGRNTAVGARTDEHRERHASWHRVVYIAHALLRKIVQIKLKSKSTTVATKSATTAACSGWR